MFKLFKKKKEEHFYDEGFTPEQLTAAIKDAEDAKNQYLAKLAELEESQKEANITLQRIRQLAAQMKQEAKG